VLSLKTNPDKLLVFVDAGKIYATAAPECSFEYRFTLNVSVTDFADDVDALFIALIVWVQANQPDLISNEDNRRGGVAFEVDHLTQTTCDVSIKIRLTESGVVETNARDARTVSHVDEPAYEWNLDSFIS
jgi:hypothetical protein